MQPSPQQALLLAQLQGASPEQRAQAALAIGQLREEWAAEALHAALADGDTVVRSYALMGLGNLRYEAARADITALLRTDVDPQVREKAAIALAQLGGGAAVDALISALPDEGIAYVRNRIVYVLGASRDARVLPLLLDWPADDLPSTLGVVAWGLGSLGDPQALPRLLLWLKHADASLRANAAWALGELQTDLSIPALLAALQDEAPAVRAKAAWALGNLGEALGDDRMVAALIGLLSDFTEVRDSSAHVFVSQYAAEALVQIGTPQALQAVEAWRPGAREQLAPHRQKELLRALGHPDQAIRDAALDEVVGTGAPLVPALVERLRHDKNARLRQYCARALGEIGDASVVEALISALDDADEGVWSQAVAALGKLPASAAPVLALELTQAQGARKQGLAIALWRRIRDEAAFPYVLIALQADNLIIKSSAIISLWQQPDARALAMLQLALTDERNSINAYILQALQAIGTPAALKTIAIWIEKNG